MVHMFTPDMSDKYLDNTALKNLMTAMYHYCNAATEYANIY